MKEEEYSPESVGGFGRNNACLEQWMRRPWASWPTHVIHCVCDVADARLQQAWDALTRPRSHRRHRAFPARGKRRGGDLAATGLHDSQPREAGHLPGFAAVTSSVLQAARPPAAPAPGRRRRVPERLPPWRWHSPPPPRSPLLRLFRFRGESLQPPSGLRIPA